MSKMNELKRLLDRALPSIARRLQNELVLKSPVDTGRLRNSLKVIPTNRGLLISGVEYLKYVLWGTPPHIIKPKNKKSLRFEVGKKERLSGKKKGKNIVFAKEVRHPGTRPNPFVQIAIQTKLKKIIIEELSNKQ